MLVSFLPLRPQRQLGKKNQPDLVNGKVWEKEQKDALRDALRIPAYRVRENTGQPPEIKVNTEERGSHVGVQVAITVGAHAPNSWLSATQTHTHATQGSLDRKSVV